MDDSEIVDEVYTYSATRGGTRILYRDRPKCLGIKYNSKVHDKNLLTKSFRTY